MISQEMLFVPVDKKLEARVTVGAKYEIAVVIMREFIGNNPELSEADPQKRFTEKSFGLYLQLFGQLYETLQPDLWHKDYLDHISCAVTCAGVMADLINESEYAQDPDHDIHLNRWEMMTQALYHDLGKVILIGYGMEETLTQSLKQVGLKFDRDATHTGPEIAELRAIAKAMRLSQKEIRNGGMTYLVDDGSEMDERRRARNDYMDHLFFDYIEGFGRKHRPERELTEALMTELWRGYDNWSKRTYAKDGTSRPFNWESFVTYLASQEKRLGTGQAYVAESVWPAVNRYVHDPRFVAPEGKVNIWNREAQAMIQVGLCARLAQWLEQEVGVSLEQIQTVVESRQPQVTMVVEKGQAAMLVFFPGQIDILKPLIVFTLPTESVE